MFLYANMQISQHYLLKTLPFLPQLFLDSCQKLGNCNCIELFLDILFHSTVSYACILCQDHIHAAKVPLYNLKSGIVVHVFISALFFLLRTVLFAQGLLWFQLTFPHFDEELHCNFIKERNGLQTFGSKANLKILILWIYEHEPSSLFLVPSPISFFIVNHLHPLH